ncbi:hypothetical protein HAV15_004677 [Penicillium sp. str. |nr:hypothetical protein HAV15_004677 [Penicillium sp. str. \
MHRKFGPVVRITPTRFTSKSRSGLPAIPMTGSKVPENWNRAIIKVAASIVSSTRDHQSPEHDLYSG